MPHLLPYIPPNLNWWTFIGPKMLVKRQDSSFTKEWTVNTQKQNSRAKGSKPQLASGPSTASWQLHSGLILKLPDLLQRQSHAKHIAVPQFRLFLIFTFYIMLQMQNIEDEAQNPKLQNQSSSQLPGYHGKGGCWHQRGNVTKGTILLRTQS